MTNEELKNLEDEKQIDNIGKATGFFLFRNLINNYNEMKQDETKRYECKKYGNIALILSLIGIAVSVGFILIFGINVYGVEFGGFGSVLTMILSIIAGIVLPLGLGIYSMVFAVMQVRLNRKAIGIVGLITATLCILSSIAMVVLMIII